MEFFEADRDDVEASARGRNVPIRLGQVRRAFWSRARVGVARGSLRFAPFVVPSKAFRCRSCRIRVLSSLAASSSLGSNCLCQVGIRCVHCACASHRSRGSVYYPIRLDSLYQAVQNMANNHFLSGACPNAPGATVREIAAHKARKPRHKTGAGN
jgi:hypothetical protein